MYLLITLPQAETRRSSEYNQADNLHICRYIPNRQTPGLLHSSSVRLLGLVTVLQALWWSTLLKIYQSTQELLVTSPVSRAKERSISDALGTYHLHPPVQVTTWLRSSQNQLEQRENRKKQPWPTEIWIRSYLCLFCYAVFCLGASPEQQQSHPKLGSHILIYFFKLFFFLEACQHLLGQVSMVA